MRILILVLTYTSEPFGSFARCQLDGWDSVYNPNIDTIYYHGGEENRMYQIKHSVTCQVNTSDDYENMHWKFKLALDCIDYHAYDIIFRTNSCSYIVKERLLKVAEMLPKTMCYAGWQNGTYISGAGIFFSPDVLDILKDELTPNRHGAEDVLIGQILKDRVPMIDDRSRTDAEVEGFKTFEGYHFRAKTSNDHKDRYRDIDSLRRLHNYFK